MKIFTEITKAGLKIYQSKTKKHLKTIPCFYEPIAKDFILKCDLTKKRLNQSEREVLKTYDFEVSVFSFLKELEKSEKYVFELVENAKAVEVRKVNQRAEAPRFELVFDNGVKLKINESFYLLCENKTEVNLNY
jgi:hypothetical protein